MTTGDDPQLARRSDVRMAMFALRERLWTTIREVAFRWGQGFPGISDIPHLALANHMLAHCPFKGDQGEMRLQTLRRFDEFCRRDYADIPAWLAFRRR